MREPPREPPEREELDEALAAFDTAVRLKPDYAEAYFNRGNALKLLHRAADALASYDKAVATDTTRPQHVVDTMAFMFETRNVLHPTRQALESPQRQRDYQQCWQDLGKHFDPGVDPREP